jgi:hypothetical protein
MMAGAATDGHLLSALLTRAGVKGEGAARLSLILMAAEGG